MFNLKDELERMDREYMGDMSILGNTLNTMADKLNSPRAGMLSKHLDQRVNLLNPEFPKVFMNFMNVLAEYSTGYKETKSNYIVVDKIVKFEGLDNHIYLLILYNKDKDIYEIVERTYGEILTEGTGYQYNNEVIDSLTVGDEVDKGRILYKSLSFDEENNYRYGINLTGAFIVDESNIEDSIEISESAAKRLTSNEFDVIRIPLNENDILTNHYGDRNRYKCIPDVLEPVKDMTVANRLRINKRQIWYDLKSDNLNDLSETGVPYYSQDNGDPSIVMDINIYCNKELEDIPKTKYNAQLLHYIENDIRYHTEIVDKLGHLIENFNVSDDIRFMYKRSLDILDPSVKFKDVSGSMFSNMIIEITTMKTFNITDGGKLTGRYGDKCTVIVVPDSEMPYTETGKRIDAKFNSNSNISRLNPGQNYEMELNFIFNRLIERFDFNDVEYSLGLIKDALDIFSPMSKKFRNWCDSLNDNDKYNLMLYIAKNGMSVHIHPIYDTLTLEMFAEAYEKFNIELYTCYIDKEYVINGVKQKRTKKLINKLVVGEKYIMKLKHSPLSKFSSRSTGYLNSKGLPFKSSSSSNNTSLYPKSAIKFGDMENNILLLNNNPEALAKMAMLDSNSTLGRRSTSQLYSANLANLEELTIDERATNRTAEIYHVAGLTIGSVTKFYDSEEHYNEELQKYEERIPTLEEEAWELFQMLEEDQNLEDFDEYDGYTDIGL